MNTLDRENIRATLTQEAGRFLVEAHAVGLPVDRTHLLGWTVPLEKPKLATRLKRAIESGAVFYDWSIRTDVHGKTYVQASARVMGRHMNADLRRLGF